MPVVSSYEGEWFGYSAARRLTRPNNFGALGTVARIEAGQSPVDPLFRETRAQRKAREDAEKERKKNLPDPFREFVEEGDPYYEYLAREEKYRQQGKRPGDVLD